VTRLSVLLFGATGNAGGAVLSACLDDPGVAEVRAVARRPLAAPPHRKLRVILHQDYLDLAAVRMAFQGVDVCLFCLGISVRQVSGEAEYRRITLEFPMAAARTLAAESPDAIFQYLSGRGASEQSRMMWARVKAEAEAALREAVGANAWRPAFIDGADSSSSPASYQWLRPLFRLLSGSRRLYVRGDDIGRAMLRATRLGLRATVFENPAIRDLADDPESAVRTESRS
jgi:uncharacterized protein YbjT (DUF2867 family)